MVKTFADIFYQEMRNRSLPSSFPKDGGVSDNILRLGEVMGQVNITKCTLPEFEASHPSCGLLLKYLLQANESIDFGLCEHYKLWQNQGGWQYRCRFDNGTGKSIQIGCGGSLMSCERKEQYQAYLQQQESKK